MRSTAAAAARTVIITTATAVLTCLSSGTAAFAQQQGQQPTAQRREQSSQQQRQPSSSSDRTPWRGDRGSQSNGRPGYPQQGQQQGQWGQWQGQHSGSPSNMFPPQAPAWVYGQQAPSWVYGQQPPQSSTPFFPPTSTGNTTSLQPLPPISGPGYYTLPDGSRIRPDGSARTREREGQYQTGSGYPLGNGATFYPYPRNPDAPIAPDAPYTRGPIRGTFQGRGPLSNVLIFPGYRPTYIVH